MSPLRNMLEYETNVVEQLFSCSLALAQWDFVGSLLHLHNYNQTYKEFIEGYKSRERSLMGKKIIKVRVVQWYGEWGIRALVPGRKCIRVGWIIIFFSYYFLLFSYIAVEIHVYHSLIPIAGGWIPGALQMVLQAVRVAAIEVHPLLLKDALSRQQPQVRTNIVFSASRSNLFVHDAPHRITSS